MYIPEDKISEILNTSDIVDVISESVILKKSGTNFFGLCPFHSEKTPSFSVSPAKQIFYCFGCSAGGNVLSFIMKYHGISLPEAAMMLARKYNITIETAQKDPRMASAVNLKESLFRLNKMVMGLYQDMLGKSGPGKTARAYLEQRGISGDIVREFRLGFAPDRWDLIVDSFRKHGIKKNIALKSGLVLENKKRSGYYDRFRNRIMFPIFDINMQVAGFGGRVMDDSMPKYMNSPETAVYHKSRMLYGLHAAKQYCRQSGYVHIVEGYFDFLSLYQHGIKNTVASLGTALTADHVRILKGYAPKMVLVFDSDTAGINAAKRSIRIFVNEGVDTRILILPGDNDPDSFVMEHGPDAFNELVSNADTVMDFLLRVSVDTHGMSVQGRVKVLDDMKIHISEICDSALRSLYIRELSETLNIDEKAVLEKVRDVCSCSSAVKPGQVLSRDGEKQDIPLESDRREKQIIALMLNYPQIINEIRTRNIPEYFNSERLRYLAQKIIHMARENHGNISVPDIMKDMQDDRDREIVAACAMDESCSGLGQDAGRIAQALITRIIRIKKRQENTLTSKIISAEKGCDSEWMDLLRQRQAEIRQLHDR